MVEQLERAVRLDTSNERAAKMLERMYGGSAKSGGRRASARASGRSG